MKYVQILIFFLFYSVSINTSGSDENTFVETKMTLKTNSGEIFGTMVVPRILTKEIPFALIIAGSGPTDRDGNNLKMKNDSLKMLAFQLAKNGIGSLRYDKRGIAESKASGKIESELRFDDYIHDAEDWITFLKKDKRFPKITIIGHSEGSLIGMIASRDASQFISIAGVGQPADKTLKEQLSTQSKEIKEMCFPIIDSLKQGNLVDNINPVLNSLFRPSVQPYLVSWFKYDPQIEIKKLSIPILIIQGTNDIQVTVQDANNLFAAKPQSQLVLIEKMNHIFRIVEGDRQANIETYNNTLLSISDKMVAEITKFILNR